MNAPEAPIPTRRPEARMIGPASSELCAAEYVHWTWTQSLAPQYKCLIDDNKSILQFDIRGEHDSFFPFHCVELELLIEICDVFCTSFMKARIQLVNHITCWSLFIIY